MNKKQVQKKNEEEAQKFHSQTQTLGISQANRFVKWTSLTTIYDFCGFTRQIHAKKIQVKLSLDTCLKGALRNWDVGILFAVNDLEGEKIITKV